MITEHMNKPTLDRATVNSCDLLHRAILEVLADRGEVIIEEAKSK